MQFYAPLSGRSKKHPCSSQHIKTAYKFIRPDRPVQNLKYKSFDAYSQKLQKSKCHDHRKNFLHIRTTPFVSLWKDFHLPGSIQEFEFFFYL